MGRKVRGKGEGASEVDVLVGQRLREFRMLSGLSQTDLAESIGLTFQQLQKYERGVNRISASKLYMLACHLNVPVAALFSEVEVGHGFVAGQAGGLLQSGEEPGSLEDKQLRSREALVLARHFMRIKDASARAAIKSFAEACAGLAGGRGPEDAAPPAAKSGSRKSASGQSVLGTAGGGGPNGRRGRRPRNATWHPTDIDPS